MIFTTAKIRQFYHTPKCFTDFNVLRVKNEKLSGRIYDNMVSKRDCKGVVTDM